MNELSVAPPLDSVGDTPVTFAARSFSHEHTVNVLVASRVTIKGHPRRVVRSRRRLPRHAHDPSRSGRCLFRAFLSIRASLNASATPSECKGNSHTSTERSRERRVSLGLIGQLDSGCGATWLLCPGLAIAGKPTTGLVGLKTVAGFAPVNFRLHPPPSCHSNQKNIPRSLFLHLLSVHLYLCSLGIHKTRLAPQHASQLCPNPNYSRQIRPILCGTRRKSSRLKPARRFTRSLPGLALSRLASHCCYWYYPLPNSPPQTHRNCREDATDDTRTQTAVLAFSRSGRFTHLS